MRLFFLLGLGLMDFKLRAFQAAQVPKPHNEIPILELSRGYKAVDLEIGCGAGMHAIRYARLNPDRFLLAVERTSAKFEGFAARIKNHEPLPNLKALRDDGVAVVTHAIPSAFLDRVFLLYPNPYPKESQANKRWHRMPFLARLHEVMKPEAELVLATNEVFYKDEALAWLPGTGLFELLRHDSFVQADVGSAALPHARTHFEKKYLLAGQTIHNMIFRKS